MVRDATDRLAPWLDRPEVLALCGLRRAGKSTLMRQMARWLVDVRKVPQRSTLFVNFEEPIFLELGQKVAVLDRVFDTYFELARPEAVPYLFLDEIQNVDGWARWVRTRAETGRAKIVVSGSSSRLVEPEVASVLTGRNLTHTLWPLSFREFLRFRGVELKEEAAAMAQGARVRQELAQYLRYGGLPEVVLAGSDDVRDALLRQYFRDILYRDVVSRHQIRDVRSLEQVAHHLLANTANLFTYNKLKNAYGLAMDQVRSYTSFLEECYLVRSVPKYSPKLSVQSRAPRKIYATDTGLRTAVAFRFSPDVGRVAETAVHNQLVRDEDTRLFYHRGRRECDFVAWKGDTPRAAIQVCYDPTDRLPRREIAGLVEAMEALDLAEGTVITHRRNESMESDGRRIRLQPLWLWLAQAHEG